MVVLITKISQAEFLALGLKQSFAQLLASTKRPVGGNGGIVLFSKPILVR
ncbi:MAG: hypothetical protein LBT05_14430 [Planctomycetaceae bacterium]|jgi:hypothetical protein|nr:hypothetical protein [Planctomycetaceae bacterium]